MALGGVTGKPITVEELADFFEGDAEGVLGFIESIGTPQDADIARHLPFSSRVRMLHQLVATALDAPLGSSPLRGPGGG